MRGEIRGADSAAFVGEKFVHYVRSTVNFFRWREHVIPVIFIYSINSMCRAVEIVAVGIKRKKEKTFNKSRSQTIFKKCARPMIYWPGLCFFFAANLLVASFYRFLIFIFIFIVIFVVAVGLF